MDNRFEIWPRGGSDTWDNQLAGEIITTDFFGVIGETPNYLNYSFNKDDLPKVDEGIGKCLIELGVYLPKLDKFFNEKDGYNDEMLMAEFNIDKERVRNLLTWYARLQLGQKIKDCIIKCGYCSFEAEL